LPGIPVRKPAWKDAFICGGDVGVGTEQCCDATVEIPAESYFLAGSFAVEVKQDDLGGDLAEELVGFAERVVTAGHEDAALKVHDGVLLAVAELALIDAKTGGADSVVGGTQNAAAADV